MRDIVPCLGCPHHVGEGDGGASLRALPQAHKGGVKSGLVGGVDQVTQAQHRHGDPNGWTVDGRQ